MTPAVRTVVIPDFILRRIGAVRLHYLSIVWMLVRRDLKVKYRGTVLGYLWSMLNPLLFMSTISVVFSHLVRGIPNYSIFVLAGILFWNMVSITLIAGTGSLVGNAHLIQKIRVPMWVFPMVPLGSSLTNLALALIPYSIVCLVLKVGFSSQVFLLPIVLFILAVFLTGISLGLASLNVFFRDVAHVLEPVMTLLFYATPIIYDRQSASMPENISSILSLNPFVHFVEAFRSTMFPGATPITWMQIGLLVGMAGVSLALGGFVYKRVKTKIPLHL